MQAKEQDKNPQDQINEEEIAKLPERVQSNDRKDDPRTQKIMDA